VETYMALARQVPDDPSRVAAYLAGRVEITRNKYHEIQQEWR